MKLNTEALIGPALDWAVVYARLMQVNGGKPVQAQDLADAAFKNGLESPSTNWSQGGPIIDSEGISIIRCDDDYGIGSDGYANGLRIPVWCATTGQHGIEYSTDHQSHEAMYQVIASEVFHGPTALIAAMRCYVASKLGNTVDVPDELIA